MYNINKILKIDHTLKRLSQFYQKYLIILFFKYKDYTLNYNPVKITIT